MTALQLRMQRAGRASALANNRVGNSAWGARMRRRRGYLAQQRSYPTLAPIWFANGPRKRLGLPLIPVPDVGLIRGPGDSGVSIQHGRVKQGNSASK